MENFFFKNKHVIAVNLYEDLNAFSEFLYLLSDSCILVAHNRFDFPRLLVAIAAIGLMKEWTAIKGFSDSLNLIKKRYPDRKGSGSFCLFNLAQEFLNIYKNAVGFHEALFDVIVLRQLINVMTKEEKLVEMSQSVENICSRIEKNRKISSAELIQLKPIVSRKIIGKSALGNLTTNDLIKTYREGGEKVLNYYYRKKRIIQTNH